MSLTPQPSSTNAWIRHFDRMATVSNHQNSPVYFLKKETAQPSPPQDLSSVTVVEPTQQVVQQAKEDLNREQEIEEDRIAGLKYSSPPMRKPPSKRSRSSVIQTRSDKEGKDEEDDALQGI